MNRFLTSCYHLLWYTVATLLILAAVLVTAARLALPGIGSYKDNIQAWVSNYMDYPVVINDISADWTGWVPNLRLTDIDLLEQDGKQRIVRFSSASLGIDIFSSLWSGEIIPQHLAIAGLTLSLTRHEDGTISLSNQTMQGRPGQQANPALTQWLMKQRYIILEDATIDWTDNKRGTPLKHFEQVRVALKNDNGRRQLDASVNLPAAYGKNMVMRMDILGNPLEADWNGVLYIEANQLNVDSVVENTTIDIERGFLDLKLWTQWEAGKLLDITADAVLEGVVLVAGNYQNNIQSAEIMLEATRQGNQDWSLQFGLENIKTANGLWPASNHELLLRKHTDVNEYLVDAKLSFLRLQDILPPLIYSQTLPIASLQGIDPGSVSGDLTNTEIRNFKTNQSEAFTFETEAQQLALIHTDSQLAVDNVNGQIAFDGKELDLAIDSEAAVLRLGKLYSEEKTLEQLKASLSLNLEDTPTIDIDALSFILEAMPIELSGDIRLDDEAPYIDLIGRISESSIETLPTLLPLQTHPKFLKWAPNALVGGTLNSCDVIFRGAANKFPFREDEGLFKALINISDATINYMEGWPYVDQLTAQVVMENDDLLINSSSGYVFDASIAQVNARIPDISKGNHHIYIDGSLSGHTRNLPLFITQSPLRKNRGLYDFSQRQILGTFDLDIKLDVPLGGGKTNVDGNISFNDTMLESELPGLGLTDMNGNIQFNRSAAWGENITALYHGKPVSIEIPFDEKKDGRSKFIVSGEADKVFIIQELGGFFPALLNQKHSLFEYFEGGSKWSIEIESIRDPDGELSRNIVITSPLEGVAIGLPAPVGKDAASTRPLTIKTSMTGARINQIDFLYDNFLFPSLYVDNSNDFKIDKIEVDVGKRIERDRLATEDVVVRGNIDKLDLGTWFKFFNSKRKPNTAVKKPDRSLALDLDVAELKLLNQSYADTSFTVKHTQPEWQVSFLGDDISGQATYTGSTPTANNKLAMQLERLVIKKQENATAASKQINVNSIPELDVSVDDFVFHDRQLGTARLLTSNKPDRIEINSLEFSKPGMTINTSGNWNQTNGIDQTSIETDIETDSLAALMQTMGGERPNIEDAAASFKMKLSWQDSPVKFDIDKVEGDLDVDVGKGQLIDLNPSAGRLLGLLSITTLPRRLSLDFSDLFEEGFAFDRIEGNFLLQKGEAYTNDLRILAPAADIYISGRTGFVARDYDQVATVMPKISSSMPVAGALFGPIGIGIGTAIFLAGEVFKSIPKEINKILSYQYSIQGSWANPDIKKIKEENPSS